ncbi:MAG: T9SS type A sorting domain-containing protein [Bacteroidales bacterium]|nr:T9SS type A sorting domain-containing protein [Bacteroidales bacterium]
MAQVTVNNYGKFIVGNNMHTSYNNEDRDNILSATIFGKEGTFNAGSKLSFGDFGSFDHNGANVFIGEYEQTLYPNYQNESDQLWLHGKNGMYFTYNNANKDNSGIIAYFDLTKSTNFTFVHRVQAIGFSTIATPIYKTNITSLEKSLYKLNELKGVKYDFLIPVNQNNTTTNNTNLSPKEQQDMAFFSQLDTQLNTSKLQIGLLPEDLAVVFPELVDTNADGEIYIDYIGLIPVIIEALKEQSLVIRAQSQKINELNKDTGNVLSGTATSSSQSKSSSALTADTTKIYNAFLYQNTPNPFTATTEIQYFLPAETTSASILIFNMQGGLIATYPLSATFGFGSVIISGALLNAGIYFYTLIVNNHEIDTKKMILTQ